MTLEELKEKLLAVKAEQLLTPRECQYVNPDHLEKSCIVGALMTPEERMRIFDEDLNEFNVVDLDNMGFLPERLQAHVDILHALQKHFDAGGFMTPESFLEFLPHYVEKL